MRAIIGLGIGLLIGVTIVGGMLALAQLAGDVEPTMDPKPTETSTAKEPAPTDGPKTEPIATSSKGTLFTESTDAKTEDATVKPSSSREDVSWEYLWLKSSVAGTHYNLNQKAKAADSDATNWSRVFHEPAPFRDLDGLYFCGPEPTMEIRIADSRDWSLVYVGTIEGVDPCN